MDEIDTYRQMLRIDQHSLDTALQVQPDVMERISRRVAALEREAATARESRKTAEALANARARTDGASVAEAEAITRSSPTRAAAVRDELDADRELAEWKGLYEAWKARGFALKELVALWGAQYFTTGPSVSAPRGSFERPLRQGRDYSRPAPDEAPATRQRRRVAE